MDMLDVVCWRMLGHDLADQNGRKIVGQCIATLILRPYTSKICLSSVCVSVPVFWASGRLWCFFMPQEPVQTLQKNCVWVSGSDPPSDQA